MGDLSAEDVKIWIEVCDCDALGQPSWRSPDDRKDRTGMHVAVICKALLDAQRRIDEMAGQKDKVGG